MPSKNDQDQFPYEFICKDTNIKLKLRKVPFTVTAQLHTQYEKEYPAPKPPTQKIDYGDGDKVDEPNLAHPYYIKLLEKYDADRTTWVNNRAMHIFADYAIQCDVDKDAVNSMRQAMKAQKIELDPDDKFVYVWNIAVGTALGYGELFSAIQRRSQVTNEAVQEALDRFPNKVSQ